MTAYISIVFTAEAKRQPMSQYVLIAEALQLIHQYFSLMKFMSQYFSLLKLISQYFSFHCWSLFTAYAKLIVILYSQSFLFFTSIFFIAEAYWQLISQYFSLLKLIDSLYLNIFHYWSSGKKRQQCSKLGVNSFHQFIPNARIALFKKVLCMPSYFGLSSMPVIHVRMFIYSNFRLAIACNLRIQLLVEFN